MEKVHTSVGTLSYITYAHRFYNRLIVSHVTFEGDLTLDTTNATFTVKLNSTRGGDSQDIEFSSATNHGTNK